jgi:hypothetical protein
MYRGAIQPKHGGGGETHQHLLVDAYINEAARTIMSVKTSRKYQRKIGVSILDRTMVIVTVRSEFVSPRCPDCAVGLEKGLAKKNQGSATLYLLK